LDFMSQKIALLDRFIFFQLYKWGYVKGCIKSEKLYLEMFRLKWHHVVFFFRPENVKRLYIKDAMCRVYIFDKSINNPILYPHSHDY